MINDLTPPLVKWHSQVLQVMHPILCDHTMQIARSLTDRQRFWRRFATVCGNSSVAQRTDLHSTESDLCKWWAPMLRHLCRLRRRGHYHHAAKETRTCLSLRELSLLWSAPHSIVTHKTPPSRRSCVAASLLHTHQANTILFLILLKPQAFPLPRAFQIRQQTKQNKAINSTPSHQAKAK
jgi:hypothetical protein